MELAWDFRRDFILRMHLNRKKYLQIGFPTSRTGYYWIVKTSLTVHKWVYPTPLVETGASKNYWRIRGRRR